MVNMKAASAILLLILVQFVKPQAIIHQDFVLQDDGGYTFSYSTEDMQFRTETGFIANKGRDDEHLSVFGSYSYIDPSNKLQIVRYSADINGYRVLPAAPAAGGYSGGDMGITTCMLNTLCGQGI